MTLRGFGFTFVDGGVRVWYAGADGVRRYMDDTPVDPPTDYCAEADAPPELDEQTDTERRTAGRVVNLSLLLGAVTLGGQLI